jgi:hydroxymethylpyrimidine pyrophosphatase-like HAD family hydrolase
MRYLALCSDYDGTAATQGHLAASTIAAFERVRASGRKLLLVTGRRVENLREVCDRLDLFDRIVAENGALICNPSSHEQRILGPAPPPILIETLRARGVGPLAVGHVVVAAPRAWEFAVVRALHDLALQWQIILNRDAIMVLPASVNKAAGLTSALEELDIAPAQAIGIGDAENDLDFLAACGIGVAVSNALPRLKETADIVTAGACGAGVEELIRELLADDLAARA